MSSFDDHLMKGFTEHTKTFDKWCEKAARILGKVTQCGIWEMDSSGHGFFATNRTDYGEEYLANKSYLLDPFYSYVVNLKQSKLQIDPIANPEHGGYFDLDIQCPYLDVGHVITFKERIDENTMRSYGFASDSSRIHDALVNNFEVFKKFLAYFKDENEEALKFIKDNKAKFTDIKEDFFVHDNANELTDREKTNAFLITTGVLEKDQHITSREWQCAMLYSRGKTAQQTGEMLNISRRTVESHFISIKSKLRVKAKSDILETIK